MVLVATKHTLAVAAVASLTAALLSASPVRAQAPAFLFTNIDDSTDAASLGFFGEAPSINNAGTVAFTSGAGILTGNGSGTFTTITDGTAFSFLTEDPAINDSGTVAFNAGLLGTRFQGIFTGNGGALTTIAGVGDSFRNVSDASINAAGTVAFGAGTGFALTSVFTGNGGALTTIATTSPTGFSGFGGASINSAGTVAFLGIQGTGSATVAGEFSGLNGATTIGQVTGFGPAAGSEFSNPAINNAGRVAFFGTPDANGQAFGVFTGDGGALDTIVDINSDPNLIATEHPSLNNAGAVAFESFEADGTEQMLLSLPGAATPTRVLQTGDTLFGATVTSLFVGAFALNDNNQLTFSYTLDDGRTGIGVARLAASSPTAAPEPGSLLLFLPILALALVRRSELGSDGEHL